MESKRPPGWMTHSDPWNGFLLDVPPGFTVQCRRGIVSASRAQSGGCQALLWPVTFAQPTSARSLARDVVGQCTRANPTFEAWELPGADDRHVMLRTRQVRQGVALEGGASIVAEDSHGLISRFETESAQSNQWTGPLVQVLHSFRPQPAMPRVPFLEPGERAFQSWIPRGWLASGMVNRRHIGGAAVAQFSTARDPGGLVQASVPGTFWMFQDTPQWLSWLGGGAAQPYRPAHDLASGWLLEQMKTSLPGVRMEGVVSRPDMLPLAYLDLAKAGFTPATIEVSVANLTVAYDQQGKRLRETLLVQAGRPIGPMAMGGTWTALITQRYRAPIEEFQELEPVLQGILDSYAPDPAWEQQELARTQAISMQIQMDTSRRLMEISRTLSETTDIITSGYWERQAAYDRVFHKWSNAMLGYQDMRDDSGQIFRVPSGHEQSWRNGLNEIFTGGYLVNPDPRWHKLEPTGT